MGLGMPCSPAPQDCGSSHNLSPPSRPWKSPSQEERGNVIRGFQESVWGCLDRGAGVLGDTVGEAAPWRAQLGLWEDLEGTAGDGGWSWGSSSCGRTGMGERLSLVSGSVILTGHSPPLGPEGAGGSLAQALAQSGEGRGGPGSQCRSHTGKWKERPWDAGSASIPPSIDWVKEPHGASDGHRALWGTLSDAALPADPGGLGPREERGHPAGDSQRWGHMVSGEGPRPSLLQGCRGAPSPLLETPRWPAGSGEVNSRAGAQSDRPSQGDGSLCWWASHRGSQAAGSHLSSTLPQTPGACGTGLAVLGERGWWLALRLSSGKLCKQEGSQSPPPQPL